MHSAIFFLTGKKNCLARPLRARGRPARNKRVWAETVSRPFKRFHEQVFAVHFTARRRRRGYLPLAVIAEVAGAAVMLDACDERESDILPPSLICRHSVV